jgi:hypothetical protein
VNQGESPLGAQSLDDVLQILADHHFLVRLRLVCHVEYVRENVVLGVVVDKFDGSTFRICPGNRNGSDIAYLLLDSRKRQIATEDTEVTEEYLQLTHPMRFPWPLV